MADCPLALVLSAVLLTFNLSVFTRAQQDSPGCNNFIGLPSFVFLTAVFAWLSAQNLNLFACSLTSITLFFYEFLASLFVMETALFLFWRPLEKFISSTLPPLVENLLLQENGGCTLFGFFCSGHTLIFSVLVHITAFNILWCVLFGFGVVHEPVLKI